MCSRSPWLILALGALLVAGCGPAPDSQEATDERMAAEHEGDTPVPSPAAGVEPAASVEASEVVYADLGGQEVTGYLARPEGGEGELPAVIVIHEWWGLNDNIRSMARQLAGEGYLALAVDLYGGEVASEREGARALMAAVRENPAAAEENLRQAHAYLTQEHGAPRVGSIGWCFGGGWSLSTGLMLGGEVQATVIYYGRVRTDRQELAALQAPVLGIFGSLDGGIPVELVREFESAAKELGKDVRVHVYEGADHAFANPSGTRYHEEHAKDAWEKTLAFFEETLKV